MKNTCTGLWYVQHIMWNKLSIDYEINTI